MDIKEALNFDGLKYFYRKYIKPISTDTLNAYVWKQKKKYINEVLGEQQGSTTLGDYYYWVGVGHNLVITYANYLVIKNDKIAMPDSPNSTKFSFGNSSSLSDADVLKGKYVCVGEKEAGSDCKRFYKIDKNATFTTSSGFLGTFYFRCNNAREVLGIPSSIEESYLALKNKQTSPTEPDKSDDYSYTYEYVGTIGQALSKISTLQQ